MYQIGSIISIENQIFELGKDNTKTQIDHTKRRPALVIAEDEECFYYLTLTSKPLKGCVGYLTNETIKSNGKINYSKENKTQYVQVRHIYSKKIYGAIELTTISDEDLLYILINLYEFHKTRDYNNFDKIEKNILETIKNLVIKINKSSKQKK